MPALVLGFGEHRMETRPESGKQRPTLGRLAISGLVVFDLAVEFVASRPNGHQIHVHA
jgi:hypothetical protein